MEKYTQKINIILLVSKKPFYLASLTSSCFRLRSEDLPPPSFSVVAELEEDSETRKGRSNSWSAPKYESQMKYNL